MNIVDWRQELNRIAVEFWCGVGDLGELPVVADLANDELGEAHPEIWDFYGDLSSKEAEALTLRLAWELNRFVPESYEGEPFARGALLRALENFLGKRMTVQALCELVVRLETAFTIGLTSMQKPENLPDMDPGWMGDLWNNCDWCDDSWTHEDFPSLVDEARRVAALLAKS